MEKPTFHPKAKKAKSSKKAKGASKGNTPATSKPDLDVQMTIVETNGKREIIFVAAPTKKPLVIDNGCSHEVGESNQPTQFIIPGMNERQGTDSIGQNNIVNTIPTSDLTAMTTDGDYVTQILPTERVQKMDETYSEIISINTSDGIIESVTPVNLIKEVSTPGGIVDVATIVAMNQGSKESNVNISALNQQVQAGTPQTSTIVSDVGFTNLLHKHLYSTTMTGTGPPLGETVLPGMEQTTTVAASSHAIGIGGVPEKLIIPEAASDSRLENNSVSLNAASQDLSRFAVPLTSPALKAGEALPQIIFVPVLTGTVGGAEGAAAAGPASASPVQQVNYMPVLAGSIPGAEPGMVVSPPIPLTNVMSPLNYGVMGAIPVPMQSPAHSVENVVYVQPNVPSLNNTVEKPTEHMPVVVTTIPKMGTGVTSITTIPCPPNIKKPQKRRQSRQKSVSSDASSVDSSETTSLMKQNVVTKKIERVRRTVNTEEELNCKVSGLVSKILSQFPKEGQQPVQQPTKQARPSPRQAKRSKSESNNNVSSMKLPHVLQTQMSANGGNLVDGSASVNMVQVGHTQGLNQEHAQLFQNKQPSFTSLQSSTSTGNGLQNAAMSQTPGVGSVFANQMQPNMALLNALQGKRLPKVPPKPLVSRIELPSHLGSPATSTSAAQTSTAFNSVSTPPMIIPQEILLKMNQSALENSAASQSSSGGGNIGVQVQNKSNALTRDFGAGSALQNQEMLITDPGLMSAAAALTTLMPANMMVSAISDAATAAPQNTIFLPHSDTIGPLEASMILSSLKSPAGSGLLGTSTGMVLPGPGSTSVLTTLVPPSLPMSLPTPVMTHSQPPVHYTQIPLTAVAEAVSSDESDYETEEEVALKSIG